MHIKRITESAPKELPVSLVDFICYKNSKSALQEIRLWIGDEKFLDMLNMFSGSYILIPQGEKLSSLYHDYMAALAIQRIRIARRGKDLSGWNQQEGELIKIAKRSKLRDKTVYKRGLKTLKMMDRIKRWKRSLEIWKKKFLEDKV